MQTKIRLLVSRQLILLSLLFCSACSSLPTKQVQELNDEQLLSQVEQLYQSILLLGPYIDKSEAVKIANLAIRLPLQLAVDYQLSTSPIIHNILVNSGLKKRGLCTHWTEDLLLALAELDLKTVQLYWAVANRDISFNLEHSAVVISAIENDFERGLVLDGWRNSGKLHFCPVADDRYKWQKHYNEVTARVKLGGRQ